jgi:hypothetical protein
MFSDRERGAGFIYFLFTAALDILADSESASEFDKWVARGSFSVAGTLLLPRFVEALELIWVWFGSLTAMAIFSLEYPRLVLGGSEPPPFGPPPYAGEVEDDYLDFFEEEASDEDWKRYHQWIKAQAETRRSCNGLVAVSHHESFVNSDVFTLKFDTYITDNILNYVVKSLKDKLELTDAPVAFFSSFFFTKLCHHGHEDPSFKK